MVRIHVISAYGLGRVVESGHPGFQKDDVVLGFLGWEEYNLLQGDTLRKLDAKELAFPLSSHVSILDIGIEFTDNKSSNDPFPSVWGVGSNFVKDCEKCGMLVRVAGDNIMLCPPFIIIDGKLDQVPLILKKESVDGKVTRTRLFLAIHTTKDGLSPQVDEIGKLVSIDPYLGEKDLDNDPVVLVCGRDWKGWVRALGSGISKTTLNASAPYRENAEREKRKNENLDAKLKVCMQKIDKEKG